MTKVCMLVLHDITYDSRVNREAKTLSQAGYRIKILDWAYPLDLGDGRTPQRESLNGVEVSRIRRGSDKRYAVIINLDGVSV